MSNFIELADDRGNVQQVPIPAQGAGFNGDDRRQVQQLSRSEAGRTASAVAAGNILTSFLSDGATSAQAAENAAAAITVLGEGLQETEYAPNPVEPQPVTRTESGIHVVQQPAAEAPSEMPTDYELPAEYAYLNDEAEEDAIVDDELEEPLPPAAEAAPVPTVELDEDDLLDPRIAALKAENDRLQKKAAHESQLRVKTSRPTWEQEAKRVFRLGDVPLLDDEDLKSIRADSKREFLRQAKTLADRNKRVIVRVAPTQRSEQEIVRETKAELWGQPPASAPPSDVMSADYEARLKRARGTGKLHNVFKEMIRGDG